MFLLCGNLNNNINVENSNDGTRCCLHYENSLSVNISGAIKVHIYRPKHNQLETCLTHIDAELERIPLIEKAEFGLNQITQDFLE